MNGPHDIPVNRGRRPAPLPELQSIQDLLAAPPPPPPQLIGGLLHQGCKLVLGGISKTNKSWCLLDLALAVASGQSWWGWPCTAAPVVYLNFELPPWAIIQRVQALLRARPECAPAALHLWNLRGFNADLTTLRPRLEQGLAHHRCGLLVVDPAYKLLGDRDENANGDIADLMNELEALAVRTGAAICIAHHFAKGRALRKDPIDRLCGAGTWARDPDALLLLTPHEEPKCYTVSSVLRHLPERPDFVVQWDYPLMRRAVGLDAHALQHRPGRHKRCTDREFLDTVLGQETLTFSAVMQAAKARLELGRSASASYLQRLVSTGAVVSTGGLYRCAHDKN